MKTLTAFVTALALTAPVAASAMAHRAVPHAHDRYANMETSYAVGPGPHTSPVVDDVSEMLLNLRGAAPSHRAAPSHPAGEGAVRRLRR